MSMLCHICCGRETNSMITLAGNITGPSLPVCIYCIPPWRNDSTHDWWYEITNDHGETQVRPSLDEVLELMDKRRSTLVLTLNQEISQVRAKAKVRDYVTKFRIADLQRLWNEKHQTYFWHPKATN